MRQNFPKELKPNCLLTRYPLCFMHGLKSLFNFHDYWHGIPEYLKDHGYEVHDLRAPWRGPNQSRNEQFRNQIEVVLKNHPKVHLISHSLGTLNALQIIQDKEFASRVSSVTFVSPPFGGTPWAELGFIGKFGKLDLFKSTNETLTEESALKIVKNSKIPPQVLAQVIICDPRDEKRSAQVRVQHTLLTEYLKRRGVNPANDGLIPLASQRVALEGLKVFMEFPGDHVQAIGAGPWPVGQKTAHEHYLDLCIFLAEHDLKTSN